MDFDKFLYWLDRKQVDKYSYRILQSIKEIFSFENLIFLRHFRLHGLSIRSDSIKGSSKKS
jgi:hypothetical protein